MIQNSTFKKISISLGMFVFALVCVSISSTPKIYAQTTVAPNSAVDSGTSLNWAGYVATGNTYTSINGSWNIPVPTFSSNTTLATDATWVGIGGLTTSDLIQAGTQAVIQNGVITYEAWAETLPSYQQILPLTVHGGDAVTVSLHEQSTDEWLLVFTDATTGQNYQETINYASSKSSAEWIEEMPAGTSGGARGGTQLLPLDNFGTVQFTGGSTTVNGIETTISGSGAQALTMIAGGNIALATPSALSTDGGGFSVNRSSAVVTNTTSSSRPTMQRQGRGYGRTPAGVQGYTRPVRQQATSTTNTSRTFVWVVQNGVTTSFQVMRNGMNMRFIHR